MLICEPESCFKELNSNGHQENLANKDQVWDHHSDWAEESLQFFMQFKAAQLTGVHGDKCSARRVESEVLAFYLDGGSVLLDCISDTTELECTDGQHFRDQMVELVEATPCN